MILRNRYAGEPTTTDPTRADPANIIEATDRNTHREHLLHRIRSLLPHWHHNAACRGVPASIMFPTTGMSSRPALELCHRCPVRSDCLAEALADPTLDHGVRGGMTANARKARRRAMRP